MPGDPFATLDLAMLGVAQVESGLSFLGRVTSDVVGADAPVLVTGRLWFLIAADESLNRSASMNTAERASLTGMVIAFVIVVLGAILESQTTCTQGTCVSRTIASVGGAALVIFGTVLLLISAFLLARERRGRPKTPSPSAALPPGTRSTANLFCRSCGAQIPADSGFCPKCGKAV
jgi:hypothetical protein